MRSVRIFLLVAVLAAGCSDDPDVDVAEEPTTTTTITTTTTTTIPPAQPVVEGLPPAIAGHSTDRTHLVAWHDGWLLIGTDWHAPGLNADPEIRALFSDEVLAVIDESGATDLQGAYDAVNRAGLFNEVLVVLAANPGLLERLAVGAASVTAVVRTTGDGQTWTDVAVDLPGLDHGVAKAWSNGRRLVLQMGTAESGGPFLVTTTDLEGWTAHALSGLQRAGGLDVAIGPAHAWYVIHHGSCDGVVPRAWVAVGDGPLLEATSPLTRTCPEVVATEAGFVTAAYDVATGEGEMWFSPDGTDWEARPPGPYSGASRGFTAVRGGILYSGYDGDGPRMWLGTPDAGSWAPVDFPVEIDATGLWLRGSYPVAVTAPNLSPIDRSWTPDPVAFSVTITGEEGRTLHIDGGVEPDDPQGFVITDPTGVVVWEVTERLASRDHFRLAGGWFDILGPDGEVVFRVNATDYLMATQEAEQAARAEFPPGTFDPRTDWWLVATDDGVDFTVVDLADPDGIADFGQAPVASEGRVLLQFEGEWLVIDVG